MYPFHPIQVTLALTRGTRIGHHPGATLAQLLKAATSLAGWGTGFPPRLWPDGVEVGRITLDKGQSFNFGLTLCDSDSTQAVRRWEQLRGALDALGTNRPGVEDREAFDNGLGGNFTVASVRSLIDPDAEQPLPLPTSWIARQVEAGRRASSLTLRWLSPLCASLPRRFGRKPGQSGDKRAGYYDARRFPLADLMQRIIRRLRDDCLIEIEDRPVGPSDIELLDPPGLGRLHWIKWQYGSAARPEILFGVMGRIVVRPRRPELVEPLVLGQYSAVGEKTNFGLGRYVIEELQSALPPGTPHHVRSRRATGLIELALTPAAVARLSQRNRVPTDEVAALVDQIFQRTFEPRPVARFLLPGSRPRLLAVPSPAERVLQRALLERLSPVLDRFLGDSCQAYRQGFGRKTAAERIQKAFRDGWRWALKADFHHFFDTVDHGLLRDKLEAYVQDDDLVDLLMKWVSSGAPQPGRGLPTGAVLSPLLANLFLADFDRQVADDGGLLVRYADDFVLLFRDPSRGRQVLARAAELAEQLKLHLNDDKTRFLELDRTPFDFLGFRFFAEKGWQYHADGLMQIEDLGWREAPRAREQGVAASLPGEQGIETARSGTWIVGPQVDWIGVEGDEVVCRSRVGGTEDRFPRRRVAELIALGPVTVDQSLFSRRDDEALGLLVADDAGRWTCTLVDEPPWEIPTLVRAQVALADDGRRRLEIARELIAAKLNNHAELALAYPATGTSGKLWDKLRSLAAQASQADDESQLLGVEGAGAAAWYDEFPRRIDRRFSFARREHPRASDPVNVMLNVAQTILHRLIVLTLIREGFAPSMGILHRGGDRHAALASDIQEPFRHLMDRVVIEATRVIAPGEFHETQRESFPLRIEPGAYRTLVAAVFRMLATQCAGVGQHAPRSYRRQIATMCRNLHRHLLNNQARFQVFRHR